MTDVQPVTRSATRAELLAVLNALRTRWQVAKAAHNSEAAKRDLAHIDAALDYWKSTAPGPADVPKPWPWLP